MLDSTCAHPTLANSRDLLFAALALQADLIDSQKFGEACDIWSCRGARPLADELIERGWLTLRDRQEIERHLERKIGKHVGSIPACWAELASNPLRAALAGIKDPILRQNLTDLTDYAARDQVATSAGRPSEKRSDNSFPKKRFNRLRLRNLAALSDWTVHLRRLLKQHHQIVSGAATAVVIIILGLAAGMLLFPATTGGESSGRERREETRAADYDASIAAVPQKWKEGSVEEVLRALADERPRSPQAEDERGFEWYYLWHLSHAERLMLTPSQPGIVYGIAFSPDCKRLASAAGAGAVKIWDPKVGGVIASLEGHTGDVYCVAYSPDGKCLASADVSGKVYIWDAGSGKALSSFQGSRNGITSLAFSPNGRHLATGSRSQEVKIWDATDGTEVLSVQSETLPLRDTSVLYSPDGKRLVTCGDKKVRVWDPGTGKELVSVSQNAGPATDMAFSPDGSRLAFCADRSVKISHSWNGQSILTLRGHNGVVHGLTYSPDGKRIASTGDDDLVRVWDATTGKELLALHAHACGKIAFSPDGVRLAAASRDSGYPTRSSLPGGNAISVWEAAWPAPEELVQREARSLVQSLFVQLGDKTDVIERLRRDAALNEPLRKEAIARAERLREDPERLNNLSWQVVSRPDAEPAAYRRALRQAEEAFRQVPKDGKNLYGYILNTVGVAQYRVGQYAQALETLTRSDNINKKKYGALAADVAFLAMANYRLGRKVEAQSEAERLRQTMKRDNTAESRSFLDEVETLLQGQSEGRDK